MARRSTEQVLRFEIDRANAGLEKAADALDRAAEAFAIASGEVRRMEDGVREARARHDRAEAALGAFLPPLAPEQLPLAPDADTGETQVSAEGIALGDPAEQMAEPVDQVQAMTIGEARIAGAPTLSDYPPAAALIAAEPKAAAS